MGVLDHGRSLGVFSLDDEDWVEKWLETEGSIDIMLSEGWTLETVEDMPADELRDTAKWLDKEYRQVRGPRHWSSLATHGAY